MSSKQAGAADSQKRGCPTRTDKRWRVLPWQRSNRLSHMVWGTLNPVRRGSEESVLDANGSKMSGAQEDGALMAQSLRLNRTAGFELQDREVNTSMFEVKVFQIVIIGLALFILTVTGLYCISICYSRNRQSKRAHVYESAVTHGETENPVAVKAVKRSTSFIKPLAFFRRPEAAKDNSRVYYIYSNPLPVGLNEEEEEERKKATTSSSRPQGPTVMTMPPSLQEYACDPSSGFILDPPIFYMQL